MGTNENPPMKYATDVDDNATVNTGGDRERTPLGGDTDHDPDITGKNMDPKHNTLGVARRDASGRLIDEGQHESSRDQGVSSNGAAGSRLDATRGPSAQVSNDPGS